MTLVWHGALNNSETKSLDLPLLGPKGIAVVGVCDDDCHNLDLQLFAATGYEVDAAKGTGATPIVRVTPRDSARYHVIVRMSGCQMNPCWYGIAVFRGGAR